jgi:hypothetical protein
LFLQDFVEHCESRRQGFVGNDSLLDRIIVLSAAWPAMAGAADNLPRR